MARDPQEVSDGYRLITSNDLSFEIAKGDTIGHKVIHKFGSASDVGTTLTPVASSKTYHTPSAAVALEVVSDDNTNDIPGGTGALSVTVTGIKDWNDGEESETYALNGTTAVAAGSWLRVYGFEVSSSGSYFEPGPTGGTVSHNSTITIRDAGTAAVWALIESLGSTGLGASEIGQYSLPKGKQAYIKDFEIEPESAKKPDVLFWLREGADVTETPYKPFKVKEIFRALGSPISESYYAPIGPFIGPCDFGWLAQASSGNTASVSIDFEILVVDD